MASEQTPEAKELALVGKVEMRIALASSEKKLEDLLKVYLSPLLLKLGSDSVAVRNKVRPANGRLVVRHCESRSPLIAAIL
jgi:proteasome component ECM29